MPIGAVFSHNIVHLASFQGLRKGMPCSNSAADTQKIHKFFAMDQ